MGVGKSTVLNCFNDLGIPTISADQIVHDLYKQAFVQDMLVERFGNIVENGQINRNLLAQKLDADGISWLETILWPLVSQRIDDFVLGKEIAVVEVPLLFESGNTDRYDYTVAITADIDVRNARVAQRGHVNTKQRDDRQLSQEQKAARADFVLDNSSTIEDLQNNIQQLLTKLK